MQFGFVILSHAAPEQVLRLCLTLSRLYGDPPIACHHDFSQSQLDRSAFPGNVQFVEDWLKTAWGRWPVQEALLRALRALYRADQSPDYFFLLSAADYPTSRPEDVLADLTRIQADAFIDSFSVTEAMRGEAGEGDPHVAHHRAARNLPVVAGRYIRARLRIPIIRLRPNRFTSTKERYPRLGAITRPLPFASPTSPFNDDYRCYAGSQWFTASRKVALKLLSPSREDLALQRHYRPRLFPEESYVQTVICNDPELTHHDGPFRWARWSGAHPKWLGVEEFDEIVASRAHFCRKFKPDDPVLDLIDDFLGIGREVAVA